MSFELGKKVCVIGAGAAGLAATKNLVEEGFEVTTFERNAYLGGLWRPTSDESQISVLDQTTANISWSFFIEVLTEIAK